MKRSLPSEFFTPTKFGIPKEGNTPRRVQARQELEEMSDPSMAVDNGNVASNLTVGKRGRGRLSVKKRGRKLNPKQKAEVKRLIAIRQELKYFSFVQAATTVSNAAGVSQLSAIPQGDTDQQRDGDHLMWCGTFEFNYQIVCGTGVTGDMYNNVRVIIFQWHPQTSPIPANILIAGPSTSQDPFSTYNHDTRSQYTIMFDSDNLTVGPASATYTPVSNIATGIKRVRMNTNMIGKQAQYIGGGTTGTNQIWLLTVSDSTVATHPTITYAGKLFFRDS